MLRINEYKKRFVVYLQFTEDNECVGKRVQIGRLHQPFIRFVKWFTYVF